MAPPKNKGDEKILSYLDVVMRRSDLGILRGPHYLNDRIIEFCFAHLASLSPSPRALLLPPSISFWLANCPDPQSLRQSADPLRLADRNLVLFPVNSNLDFVHHDSCRGVNRCHAERLFHAVGGFVDDGGEPPRFVEGFTPQQTNGYDCGLFVMAIAKVVYDWYVARSGCADGEDGWFAALKEEVNADAVDMLRDKVLRLILTLMELK
ncbi:hypothetical protein BHE74_00052840 [Ensete ventricosum]|nr:hypothetical protein BHE74_00052840 [Ensete ventricosum]